MNTIYFYPQITKGGSGGRRGDGSDMEVGGLKMW